MMYANKLTHKRIAVRQQIPGTFSNEVSTEDVGRAPGPSETLPRLTNQDPGPFSQPGSNSKSFGGMLNDSEYEDYFRRMPKDLQASFGEPKLVAPYVDWRGKNPAVDQSLPDSQQTVRAWYDSMGPGGMVAADTQRSQDFIRDNNLQVTRSVTEPGVGTAYATRPAPGIDPREAGTLARREVMNSPAAGAAPVRPDPFAEHSRKVTEMGLAAGLRQTGAPAGAMSSLEFNTARSNAPGLARGERRTAAEMVDQIVAKQTRDAQTEAMKTQAQNKIDQKAIPAQIMAGAQLGVADIKANSAENVADTRKDATLGAATIHTAGRLAVAGLDNQSRERINTAVIAGKWNEVDAELKSKMTLQEHEAASALVLQDLKNQGLVQVADIASKNRDVMDRMMSFMFITDPVQKKAAQDALVQQLTRSTPAAGGAPAAAGTSGAAATPAKPAAGAQPQGKPPLANAKYSPTKGWVVLKDGGSANNPNDWLKVGQ